MQGTGETLERIGRRFAPIISDRHFFEPDYQRWLFVDFAARFGRERILGYFGLTRERLEQLASESPVIKHHLADRLKKMRIELNPDFVLFREPLPSVRPFKYWDFLFEYPQLCPRVDGIIETKFATGKWKDRSTDFRKDVAKLAVWRDFVTDHVPRQDRVPPYTALWLFDPFGEAGEAKKARRAGFHTLFDPPLPCCEGVRVVWFTQTGETQVLVNG